MEINFKNLGLLILTSLSITIFLAILLLPILEGRDPTTLKCYDKYGSEILGQTCYDKGSEGDPLAYGVAVTVIFIINICFGSSTFPVTKRD